MDSSNFLAYAWGVAKLPGALAYLTLRLLNKKETLGTALQRLGWSSIERRDGPVLWFNVNGLGESSTLLPVVYKCLQEYNEKVTVLVTTPCLEVYKLLGESLPQRVLVQLVPLENPITILAFLRKWQPQIGVFLETPFHREIAIMAREARVRLALLNAHMPGEDMLEWHARRTSREMLKQTLSSYSLIVPQTYVDVGRFRMFGATLGQMPGWSTDLQQASELGACATRLVNQRPKIRRSLIRRLGDRQLWIAANTLPGEDTVVARIHAALRSQHQGLLTLVAPRVTASSAAGGRDGTGENSKTNNSSNSSGCSAYAAAARRLSSERHLRVEFLSAVIEEPGRLSAEVDVLLLDDADALPVFYSLSEIVLVGGSLLPSFDGASSPAAAAVAGCALLMGPHGAEFLGLASDLNHAAIMASEEVAAAVAQTGATARGEIHWGGGTYTPREAGGQSRGLPGTPGGPWPTGARSAAAVAAAGGSSAGAQRVDGMGPPESGERGGWQWCPADLPGPAHDIRPVSAPPMAPEHFQLRQFTPMRTRSPLGNLASPEPAFHHCGGGLSSGPRNLFIAPFSTPGVTYSWSSYSPAAAVAEVSVAGQQCLSSTEFATLSSSAQEAAAIAAGASSFQRRRRAIDRFRWVSKRANLGFGYVSELMSMDMPGSTSSTCDSEEEEEMRQQEEEDAGRVVFLTAVVTPTRNSRPDVEAEVAGRRGGRGSPSSAATVQLTAAGAAEGDVTSFLRSQASSPGAVATLMRAPEPVAPPSECVSTDAAAADRMEVRPLSSVSPRRRLGGRASSASHPGGRSYGATDAVRFCQGGFTSGSAAAADAGNGMEEEKGVGSSSDEGDFHDAIDDGLRMDFNMCAVGEDGGVGNLHEVQASPPLLSAVSTSGAGMYGTEVVMAMEEPAEEGLAAVGVSTSRQGCSALAELMVGQPQEVTAAGGGEGAGVTSLTWQGPYVARSPERPSAVANTAAVDSVVLPRQGDAVQVVEGRVVAVTAAVAYSADGSSRRAVAVVDKIEEAMDRAGLLPGIAGGEELPARLQDRHPAPVMLRAVLRSWKQLVPRPRNARAAPGGANPSGGLCISLPVGRGGGDNNDDCEDDDDDDCEETLSLNSLNELPTLRGYHLGHRIADIGVEDNGGGGGDDGNGNGTVDWPPEGELISCEADLRPARAAGRGVLAPEVDAFVLQGSAKASGTAARRFLEWSAPSAKSLIDPARCTLATACVDSEGENGAAADAAAVVVALQAHDDSCQGEGTCVYKSMPDQATCFRDPAGLVETWTSDMSMVGMVEGSNNNNNDPFFSGDLTPTSARSPLSSAAATREASGLSFGELSRGSLDHYLQDGNQSSPGALRCGRAAHGLTRLSGGPSAGAGASINLTSAGGTVGDGAVEGSEAGTLSSPVADAEEDDDLPPGDSISDAAAVAAGATMLPLPPRICEVLRAGEGGERGSAGMEVGEHSPTVIPTMAVSAAAASGLEEGHVESSPTAIAPVSVCGEGGGGLVSGSADTASSLQVPSDRGAAAGPHSPRATESPISDFEFGGSLTDDAGSGSPTLLAATASVHNGSGGNLLQIYNGADNGGAEAVAAATAAAAASPQAEAMQPLVCAAQARLARPSSPTSATGWLEPLVDAESPPHVSAAPAAAAARFQIPWGRSLSAGRNLVVDSNPYNMGSCFSGQMCFKWLNDGGGGGGSGTNAAASGSRSGSSSASGRVEGINLASRTGPLPPPAETAMAATVPSVMTNARRTSIESTIGAASSSSSRASSTRTSFHQVDSIGGWLDHFGSMLSQPSLGLQRSQAQHDPMVWFSQRDASGSTAVSAAALQGVASGLRAPIHSPLGALDEDVREGINPQALASVTTTLFPAAHVAMSYPAPLPLPSASPRAPPARGGADVTAAAAAGLTAAMVACGAGAVASRSLPLHPTSDQMLASSHVHRAEMAAGSAAASAFAPAQPRSAFESLAAAPTAASATVATAAAAAPAAAACSPTMRDELSVLLNSPRSPVSPLRVARVVAPAVVGCHGRGLQQAAGMLASPRGAPACASASLGYGGQPRSPAAAATGYASSSLLSPQQQQPPPRTIAAINSGTGAAVNSAEAAKIWPPSMSLPSINTPRRDLQRRQSTPARRPSPLSSPLPSASSQCVPDGSNREGVPLAAGSYGTGPFFAAMPAAAVAAASYQRPQKLSADSPRPPSESSSSCPNTPTSRAANTASSPFRCSMGDLALMRCSPVGPRPPPSMSLLHSPGADDSMINFEESFDAAVRSTPVRSPARSVAGRGSIHASPYSSPYGSASAAAMASFTIPSWRSPGPGTTYRSLFLEEEDELAAQMGGDEVPEEEDQMPLSPRANSHNVLFSMQEARDDDVSAPLRDASLHGMAAGVGPTVAAAPRWLLEASEVAAPRQSMFVAQQRPSPSRRHGPSYGGGSSSSSGAANNTAVQDGGAALTSVLTGFAAALSEASAVEAPLPVQVEINGRRDDSSPKSNLDSMPTLNPSLVLTDTEDDDDKDSAASASPGGPHVPSHLTGDRTNNRPRRITLSGDLLVVPAITTTAAATGCSQQQQQSISNPSQASPRFDDELSLELEDDPSVEPPPANSFGGGGDEAFPSDVVQWPIAQTSSLRGGCSSSINSAIISRGGGPYASRVGGADRSWSSNDGGSGGSSRGGCFGRLSLGGAGNMAIGYCRGGSLASSSTKVAAAVAGGHEDSPPRSPADRTRCPSSACPSASPVKPPLLSGQSSPIPRMLMTDGSHSPLPPPYLPVFSSQSLDGRWNVPQSPSSPSPLRSPRAATVAPAAAQGPLSPPASYASSQASDPRASPVKVGNVMKRTPAPSPPRRMAEDVSRMAQFSTLSSSAAAVATNVGVALLASGAITASPSSSVAVAAGAAAAGRPESLHGGDSTNGGPGAYAEALPTFSGMTPVRTQPAGGVFTSPVAAAAAARAILGTVPAFSPGSNHVPERDAAARQPWPGASPDISAAFADDDGRILTTRASCPAGLTVRADRRAPPTPRSGCRRGALVLSPQSYGASAQSLDLHAQRTQQQQLWDRVRAESRNASAAGTPRSARALFGAPPPLPVSFSSSSFMEGSVSPQVAAPRSPRVGMSPGRSPVFALDVAGTISSGGGGVDGHSFSRDVGEESWQLQQARFLYQAASGQGTPKSARVLFPAASPKGGGIGTAVDQAVAEPPSPSWSHVSRRLFSDNKVRGAASTGGTTAATAAGTGGTVTPVKRSVDELDNFLAHMKVQVASPVSPQPRWPQPPFSPRVLRSSGAAGTDPSDAAATMATVGFVAAADAGPAAASGAGHTRHSSQQSLQTALPQQQHGGHKASYFREGYALQVSPQHDAFAQGQHPAAATGSGASARGHYTTPRTLPGSGSGPGVFHSSGAAASPPLSGRNRPPQGSPSGGGERRGISGSSNGNSGSSTVRNLPLLPPLPRLRQLPGRANTRAVEPSAATTWPALSLRIGEGGLGRPTLAAADDLAGPDASVEAVRRQLFQRSALELSQSQIYGPAAPVGGIACAAASIPLPGMQAAAEQDALAALESQFKVAEQEAAILPIETRVPTPTALPPAVAMIDGSGYGPATAAATAAAGAAAPLAFFANGGLPASFVAPASPQGGGRSNAVLAQHAFCEMAPPSPRAGSTAAASPATAMEPGFNARAPAPGTAAASSVMDRRAEVKVQAQGAGPARGVGGSSGSAGAAGAANGPVAQSQAGTRGSDASVTSLKPGCEGGAASLGIAEHGPAIPCPSPGPTSSAGRRTVGSGSMGREGPGNGRRHVAPRSATTPRHVRHPSANVEGDAAIARPGRQITAAANGPVGGSSPLGSVGGERASFVAPCSRYAGQYLIPATQLTCDPREGPAVWMVSSEEELAAALSRLLHDTTERQSRGRAAAQGAAQLASSLVATVWSVLEDFVIAPALQEYITSGNARAGM